MTLANAATDTSAPQGIVEVLNNLLLNVVANPGIFTGKCKLCRDPDVGCSSWACFSCS